MGKFHKFIGHLLGLFCASAFAVQALAADKINLPVDRHGFLQVSGETFRYPTTAKIRAAVSGANPHVEKLAGGGLSQSLRGNIEITATGQSSPISAKVKAGLPAVKNGAKKLLKGGLAGMAVTAGLQQLLDGVDWVMNEGGEVKKKETSYDITEPPPGSVPGNNCRCTNTWLGGHPSASCSPNFHRMCYAPNGYPIFAGYVDGTGYYLADDAAEPDFTNFFAVPSAEIDAAVDNYYDPEPDDWHLLARHIDPSDPDVYAEISDIPSLLMPPTTKTIYDANGNPVEVQDTNIWYDFDITDNDSKQPAIDIRENKETKTYNEHGQLTGTETITSTSKAASSSSASASADIDIPTDCEFMPTVCRFLAWFQEPDPELSNEPDLGSLREDLDPERDFTVGTSTAGCPEPITISLAMFPSVEVSLQPLCDFVDLLRPLLLAFASYFATLIVLRAF